MFIQCLIILLQPDHVDADNDLEIQFQGFSTSGDVLSKELTDWRWRNHYSRC